MQTNSGKLFIGGISWDTDEERLEEYFRSFGEVVEAVIMKDRITGRARGFGFVVFADPSVAERVVKEKHSIDGRLVEAKKAVPRDDQNILNKSSCSSIQGSPSPGRARKIFVGGLASTVTDSDFKKYFEQFGTITDVVVMYDPNTQRPRGFGFITYDSDEAADKVLVKTFHELNGKMVEVKRAVPKELSPGPGRTSPGSYNCGLNRVDSFLNGYLQGCNAGTEGSYGLRMDGRVGTVARGQSGFSPFGSGYGMSVNFEPEFTMGFAGASNLGANAEFGRGLSPYYIGNANRLGTAIGYNGANRGNSSFFGSVTRNLWGNGGSEYKNPRNITAGTYAPSASGNTLGGSFGYNRVNLVPSGISNGQGVGPNITNNNVSFNNNGSFNNNVSFGYGGGESGFEVRRNNGGLNKSLAPSHNLASGTSGDYDAAIEEFYGIGSYYGNPARRPLTSERDDPCFSPFGFGTAFSDSSVKRSPGYVGDSNFSNKHSSRGIAA